MNIQYTFLLLLVLFLLSACTAGRILFFNQPSVEDLKNFPAIKIRSSQKAANPFVEKHAIENIPATELWTCYQENICYDNLDNFLQDSNTDAFVIVRNDSILYEKYNNKHTAHSPKIIFSISKIFITSLVPILLEEGVFKNLDQKVADFFPAFNSPGKKNISIRHLLQMTSGINHDEYNKLFKTAITYYHPDLDKYMAKSRLEHLPGQQFTYKSIDTQILGRCIEKASGRGMAKLLEEKIWQPLEMEHDGFITLDRKNGNERMYGGMAVSSRDLLKIAKLYLDNGKWNGRQIIPEYWVSAIKNRNFKNNKWWGYTNGWWLDTFTQEAFLKEDDYFAAGYNGQILYLNPKQNIIILRQGKNNGGIRWYTAISHLGRLLRLNSVKKSNVNILENPLSFAGVYSNENNETITIDFNAKKKKWNARIQQGNKTTTLRCYLHSPLVLANFRKLTNFIFEMDNQKVTGLFLDNAKAKPVYFSRSW